MEEPDELDDDEVVIVQPWWFDVAGLVLLLFAVRVWQSGTAGDALLPVALATICFVAAWAGSRLRP